MELNMLVLAALASGLSIAVIIDLLSHRIPNLLVICLTLSGLVLHISFGHFQGGLLSLMGFFTGLVCFLPFHVFGVMGAGDVKLMASVGALVGPSMAFTAVLMTVIAGGFIALAYIALRGGLFEMLGRYRQMVVLLVSRQPVYLPPASHEAAARKFPYALAIACGTSLSMWLLA